MVKAIFAVVGGFCVLVMGTMSYLGIAVLMGIESACIPLPSELIMPYAGAMSDASVAGELGAQVGLTLPVFNIFLAAIAGAIGCNLGS
jgi:membrane protein DedA with SNARE-associated domain